MKSFLGSMKYHSNCIEDYAIYASALYDLRQTEYFKISQMDAGDTANTKKIVEDSDPTMFDVKERDPIERNRQEKAAFAFTMLQVNIATTPILKQFVVDRIPVIVVYASKWGCGSITFEGYDGVFWPVDSVSRTLKSNEINYGMVEKEDVLFLLQFLDV